MGSQWLFVVTLMLSLCVQLCSNFLEGGIHSEIPDVHLVEKIGAQNWETPGEHKSITFDKSEFQILQGRRSRQEHHLVSLVYLPQGDVLGENITFVKMPLKAKYIYLPKGDVLGKSITFPKKLWIKNFDKGNQYMYP